MSKSSNKFYEVEKIKGSKTIKKQKYYLVKWKGYSEKENTWEPQRNFSTNPKIIEEYENEIKNKEKKFIVIDSPPSDKNTKKLSFKATDKSPNENKHIKLSKLKEKVKNF